MPQPIWKRLCRIVCPILLAPQVQPRSGVGTRKDWTRFEVWNCRPPPCDRVTLDAATPELTVRIDNFTPDSVDRDSEEFTNQCQSRRLIRPVR